jgi:hypothetical protein
MARKKTVLKSTPGVSWDVIKLFNRPLSKSMLETFMTCREQCRVYYLQGIRSNVRSSAAEFGVIFHQLLEVWSKNEKSKRGKFSTRVASTVKEVSEEFLDSEEYTKKELVEVAENLAVASSVFMEYAEHYQEDQKDWVLREQWLQGTVTLEVNLLFPRFEYRGWDQEKVSIDFPIGGILDGLYRVQTKKREEYTIFDTKTKGQIVESDLDELLAYDLQMFLYYQLAKQKLGFAPHSVEYDVVRRPQLRQKQSETHEEYCTRIREDIVSRREHYFIRRNNPVLPREYEAWQFKYLRGLLTSFAQWYVGFFPGLLDGNFEVHEEPYANPFHHTNPSALIGAWGRVDLFDHILNGSMVGLSDGHYQLRPGLMTDKDQEYLPRS